MKKLFGLLTILVTLLSCGPRIYMADNAKEIASEHKTIAIIPPKVSIAARKKVSAESVKEQQKNESVNFQREMYSWLLKRKSQGKIKIDLQDVQTTNALLLNSKIESLTPAQLANILNVDAVLSSNYSLSKPMSQGAAIALGVLTGAWGSTNKTTVDLSLHDKNSGKMIWNYNHKASGTFSSASSLVDNLMRNASKKLPYKK